MKKPLRRFFSDAVVRLNRTTASSARPEALTTPTKKPQTLRSEAFSFLRMVPRRRLNWRLRCPVYMGRTDPVLVGHTHRHTSYLVLPAKSWIFDSHSVLELAVTNIALDQDREPWSIIKYPPHDWYVVGVPGIFRPLVPIAQGSIDSATRWR